MGNLTADILNRTTAVLALPIPKPPELGFSKLR
jgi:hypothetical protein